MGKKKGKKGKKGGSKKQDDFAPKKEEVAIPTFDDDEDDDTAPAPVAKQSAFAGLMGSEDESDDDEQQPVRQQQSAFAGLMGSDSDDDDDDEPQQQMKPQVSAFAGLMGSDDSDDDDDDGSGLMGAPKEEEEEEKPAPKGKKGKKGKQTKKQQADDDDDDMFAEFANEEPEQPKKLSKAQLKRQKQKAKAEAAKKAKEAAAAAAAAAKADGDDDDMFAEFAQEQEAAPKKLTKAQLKRQRKKEKEAADAAAAKAAKDEAEDDVFAEFAQEEAPKQLSKAQLKRQRQKEKKAAEAAAAAAGGDADADAGADAAKQDGPAKPLSKAQKARLRKKEKAAAAAKAKAEKAAKKKPSALALRLKAEREERERLEREHQEMLEAQERALKEAEEEEKRKAEEKEKKAAERIARREQLRKEGKLLSKKQRQQQERGAQALAAMQAAGLVVGPRPGSGKGNRRNNSKPSSRRRGGGGKKSKEQLRKEQMLADAKRLQEQADKKAGGGSSTGTTASTAGESSTADQSVHDLAAQKKKKEVDAKYDAELVAIAKERKELEDAMAGEDVDEGQSDDETKGAGAAAGGADNDGAGDGDDSDSSIPDDWDVDSDEEAEAEAEAERKRQEKLEAKKASLAERQAKERARRARLAELEKREQEIKRERDAAKREAEAAAREAEKLEIQKKMEGQMRSPICCILGHVDTGKTKLLDKIRSTNVQDGEAGGITQQIGATYFPMERIKQKTGTLMESLGKQLEFNMPGLLVIDTPGHESFTNLRSRGSNLCDIAILVVDIMHGLEPQTLESIDMLKKRQTPFIVALNKVDRLYQWKATPDHPFFLSLKNQKPDTQSEFDTRVTSTIAEFASKGLNTVLYNKNKDPRKWISLVPTSAHTGEGIPDLLLLITQLTQKMMQDQLMYLSDLQCTILEVKVVEGLGTTIDVVLVNGVLHEGDTIVVCGMQGPIVTTVRALMTPQPMKEIRVKGDYVKHKTVKAAMGIKISAAGLESAIAGSQLLVCGPRDDVEDLKDEVMADLQNVLSRIDRSGVGVFVQASTLGSLEALLSFLKDMKIPVAGINIGPVHKKDVMRAAVMLTHKPEFAILLAFDVKVAADAQRQADKDGVKIFTADIIYHLFDMCTEYMEQKKKEARAAVAGVAVFPVVLQVMPEHVFNKKDPIILGCKVVEGILQMDTPLCVPDKDNIMIGRVGSIQRDHQEVQTARKGDEVAVKIVQNDLGQGVMYGRQFTHENKICSKLTRESIDLLKLNFKDDLKREDWGLVVKLKKVFKIV